MQQKINIYKTKYEMHIFKTRRMYNSKKKKNLTFLNIYINMKCTFLRHKECAIPKINLTFLNIYK